LRLDFQQKAEYRPAWLSESSARIFKQSMGARTRVGIGLSYRPASQVGWRNEFLVIDSWAPLKFTNSASDPKQLVPA
jgi:hypothetical protein